MHTYKNGLLIDDNCSILFLSETYSGNVHDKKIADASNIELPSGSALLQDTGFQGYSLKGVEIIQPFKKRKNCCLSLFDNILNQVISSSRVYIEHVIGSVKRCQVVSGVCRLKGSSMSDLVMEVCCGLHNLRVSVYPWKRMPDPGQIKRI